MIYGALWTWSYVYKNIDIRSVTPFCPNKQCRNRLNVKDDFDRMSNPQLYCHYIPAKVVCNRCGFSAPLDCARQDVNANIAQEVERRINTGEFVNPQAG